MNLQNYIRMGCQLDHTFKRMERSTETMGAVDDGRYLCVRIDGIGLSKKYLKDKVEPGTFDILIKKALIGTYEKLKQNCPREVRNIFLCAMTCSDEVSIFLNAKPNNYDGRLFKITTTIASTFSALFTQHKYQLAIHSGADIQNSTLFDAESFDGRPIQFEDSEQVYNYLFHRYATYVRNSATKLLRLNGVPSTELYSEQNYNNIDYIWSKVSSLNKHVEVENIQHHPRLYVPNSSNHFKEYQFSSISEFIQKTPGLIDEHESRLNVPRKIRQYNYRVSH
ncbi:tRNA(His) guanylyltransferase Thg1 family protein [Pleionea sp. CnH1-48]|uniref:tRNA(His) guanylyltransferase Thg1 family protein n=1 Tax=Pleionea sp. CnH1-48 TaxID=2954494 RepID=UPI002096B35C|nr:tRNA(His) guanylyltransferase Thg1 family protein [Pleionea sp. CnH1-48]MCO7224507.1 hypothetical protein [Pleionea sp. CnH1-48]